MKHKLLFCLLAIVVSTGTTHAAIANGTCGDNLTWTLNTKDSTLTIEGSGEMNYETDYAPWKEYASSIKYAYLPDGLPNIAHRAFLDCSKLISVIIPESVTTIEYQAFWGCNSLSELTLPDSISTIGFSAFYDCKLRKIVIPDKVEVIQSGLCQSCNYLDTIVIGHGVKEIKYNAFKDCAQISAFIFSSNFSQGQNYLQNTQIKSLHFMGSITDWMNIGLLNSGYTWAGWRGGDIFINGEKLTNVVFPNNVSSIPAYSFYWCTSITSVAFAENMTSLGENCFKACSNISSVTSLAPTPPSGGATCGITATKCTLYVPEEFVEVYSNSIWWEDFKEIIPIRGPFTVQFLDWDETVLSEQEVEDSKSAIAPTTPTREGYTFIGWDKDFRNVTEDMTITALYKINRYYVQFLDWNDSVLKADSVDWNTAAVAPANPARDWYTFAGWDKEFDHVTTDLVVTAQYTEGQAKEYTLLFTQSTDDSEITSKNISIDMPAPPIITGFTFIKWVVVAGDLEDTIEIQAVYTYNGLPTEAPSTVINPANPAQKLISNGNVYILTGDHTYTITGQEVK